MASVNPRLLLVGAFVLLVAVRLAPILPADFPLGAGGLFVVMAEDLRTSGYVPPAFTSYNDGTIPFVYPPLGIYVLAAIPGEPIQTLRWLPLVYSLCAVGAAWLLARELVGREVAIVAILAFAAMPITWAIEGGGATRGLGFALLLLAIWRSAVTLRVPTVPNALLTGVLGGLALLSHPTVGPAGVASALPLLLARPSWRGRLLILLAGFVALAVAFPWIATILAVHGTDPVANAIGAHGRAPAIVRLLTFGPSGLGALDPVLPAAVVGAAIALRRGDWLIPAWLVVLFLVPGGDGRYAALAWAILAGYCGVVVFDLLRPIGAHRLAAAGTLVLLLTASLIASYQRFQPVSAAVRAEMEEGPVTPRGPDDPAVEWYPALTGKIHPAAYFGYEWTDSFEERLARYNDLLP